MPSKPTCQSWCDKHDEEFDDSCTRLIYLFRKGEDGGTVAGSESPDMAAEVGQIQELGGLSEKINLIFLEVSQAAGENEPEIEMRFWNTTTGYAAAEAAVSIDELRSLHASLGQAIQVLE